MKKSISVGVLVGVLSLTGCGQNVDGIKASFSEKYQTSAEQNFTGYKVTLTAEILEGLNNFTNQNQLSSRLYFSDDNKVIGIPDINYKSEHYDIAVDSYNKAVEIFEALPKKAQAKSEEIIAQSNQTVAVYKAEIAKHKATLDEYNKLISVEFKAHAEEKEKLNALELKSNALKSAWDVEVKAAILKYELAMDANKTYRLERMYRTYPTYKCDRYAKDIKNKIAYFDSNEGCVGVRLDEASQPLVPVVTIHALALENHEVQLEKAESTVDEKNKELKRIKIIALNKTNIKLNSVASEINKVTYKIEQQLSVSKSKSEVKWILSNLMNEDDAYKKAIYEYSTNADLHNKAVEYQALNEVGLNIETFNDEQDVTNVPKGANGLFFYIFTDENDMQEVLLGKYRSGDNGKTIGDIFERSNTSARNFDFQIEDENDVLNALRKLK
jgi:hypothetical protein